MTRQSANHGSHPATPKRRICAKSGRSDDLQLMGRGFSAMHDYDEALQGKPFREAPGVA
jgi:hypothetical protein